MKKYLAVLFLLLAVCLCSCTENEVENTAPSIGEENTSTDLPVDSLAPTESILFEIPGFTAQEDWQTVSQSGLDILAVGSYTGRFFEDGSNDAVDGVSAVIVKNTGTETVEYGEISAGKDCFVLTGLPVNAYVLVLESNRGAYETITGAHVDVCTSAAQIVEAYQNDFEVYLGDGVINIRNISGRDFPGDVFVYYKNYQDGVLLGGITYRARFSGVAGGAIAQSIQSHATAENTVVLYMSYDN